MDNTILTKTTTAIPHYKDNDDDYFHDTNCSTPYVSAPSSPTNLPTNEVTTFLSPPSTNFFFYSAPTSPMHYAATTTTSPPYPFEFGSFVVPETASADELFLNGKIRPMKLSALDEDENDVVLRRSTTCNRSHRRTRSMSPLRNTTPFDAVLNPEKYDVTAASTASSGSSSRCSSAGRSSKRWLFLKDFLRSKSEGRSSSNNNNKFWQNINVSFSPTKEKEKEKEKEKKTKKAVAGKRRSAHEVHYEAKRAQADEMRRKTYLPYRQGLLGCLGFNSKSYGVLNAFLNPVSST